MRNTTNITSALSTKSAALAAAGYVATSHVQLTVREQRAASKRGGRRG